MHLTTKGQYATRAMLDLGQHYQEGPVATEDIARRQAIPKKYLEQVLLVLKGARLVHSVRGRQGGYRLARPPEEITVGEIVRVTDGPLAPISCVSQTAYRPCTCPDERSCGFRPLWLRVREAIAAVLDNTTLAEIMQQTAQLQATDESGPMYYI